MGAKPKGGCGQQRKLTTNLVQYDTNGVSDQCLKRELHRLPEGKVLNEIYETNSKSDIIRIGSKGKLCVEPVHMTDNTGGDAKSVNEHESELISSDNRLEDKLSNDRQRHLSDKLFIKTDHQHIGAEVSRLKELDFRTGDIDMFDSNRLIELTSSAQTRGELESDKMNQKDTSLPHSALADIGSNGWPNSARAKIVVNEVNYINDKLPNTAQANEGQTNSHKAAYRTPKKQNRRSLRKGKMLSNEKIEKTPELLKLFKKMENIKKETGFKGKKLYEEVEKCPEKDLKSPPISQVKLMKMKYENINSMKRLSKGGPMGVPKSDQKASHNEGTSQKIIYKCSGGRSKKKLDVQNVDPNQPKLGDLWKGWTKSKEKGT